MSKVILLADDSVTIQKVIELTFMDGDYEVIAVGNGDEALERLPSVAPDLVIADVHMPGANGYEVCRQTKEHDSGVPVLLLVGMFEPFDEAEAESAGADAHLKKPFDSQELLDLVERLQAERHGGSVAPRAKAAVEEEDDFGDETSALDAPASEDDALVWGNLEIEPEVAAEADDPAPVIFEPPEEDEGTAQGPFGTLITPGAGGVMADAAVGGEEPFGTLATGPAAEAPAIPEPPVAQPELAAAAESRSGAGEPSTPAAPLGDDDVDRIAKRIVELIGDGPVRDVAWEVIPDLAEVVIKQRIRELEAEAEA